MKQTRTISRAEAAIQAELRASRRYRRCRPRRAYS